MNSWSSLWAETATASTVTKMLAVIDGIISEMETRLQEIGTTLDKMETDLKTNKDSLAHWQQELVDLSDEKDKASNVLNTAALERNTLNGKHTVAEDAYNEYHAGFVDEAETLAKQSKAGRYGTAVLFFALGLGVAAFIVKEVLIMVVEH